MADVHVGDTNTRFLIKITDESGTVVDLSQATLLELILFKPTQSVIKKQMTLFTDGKDGIIYYDTVTGDFDEPGIWHYQAHIILPTGEKHTSTLSVRVMKNLA